LKNDISERSFANKSESIENSRYQAFIKQGGPIFFISQNDDEASIFQLIEGITFLSELRLTNRGKQVKNQYEFKLMLSSTHFSTDDILNSWITEFFQSKNIQFNFNANLLEIKNSQKEQICIFEDENKNRKELTYDFVVFNGSLQFPCYLKTIPNFYTKDSNDFNFNMNTLVHNAYSNVFGIGDCLQKTYTGHLASVLKQSCLVSKNIKSTIEGSQIENDERNREYYEKNPIFL
jgi:hypothetical protein